MNNAPSPVPDERPIAGEDVGMPRMRQPTGFALAAAGATLWAIAVAFLVPAARAGENAALAVGDDAQEIPNDRWLSLWVHDLRWAALVVVVCGLALTVRGSAVRKRIVLAGYVAALLALDGVYTWLDATGWWAAVSAPFAVSVLAAPV